MRLEASIVFDILYLFGQEKIIFHEILGSGNHDNVNATKQEY